LAALEFAWGSPSQGWEALRVLPPGDSTITAWREYADRAEASEVWGVARDALAAELTLRADATIAARAASAALEANDPESALSITERALGALDTSSVTAPLVAARIRALATLRRPKDAAETAARWGNVLSDGDRATLGREVAWAWVRAGDVANARAALGRIDDAGDGDEVLGWLALYDGNLALARTTLRLSSSPDAIRALALLSRTRSDSAPSIGRAYLALARGDSAEVIAAARDETDATPALLGVAARLRSAQGADSAAIALWTRILNEAAEAPEAAEADLAWARTSKRLGDTAGARKRLEHLILTYPNSALAPQARRELNLLRSSVPPPSVVPRTREF
jgi:tetratricopeptide (TPR) repeat protein